jgi:hypothetical protein
VTLQALASGSSGVSRQRSPRNGELGNEAVMAAHPARLLQQAVHSEELSGNGAREPAAETAALARIGGPRGGGAQEQLSEKGVWSSGEPTGAFKPGAWRHPADAALLVQSEGRRR